jgi:adenylate cyclase
VIAGIVRQKFAFDLWGDTVNVAARLSEFGAAGSIHLRTDAWSRVVGRCKDRALGLVSLKGKGHLEIVECICLQD